MNFLDDDFGFSDSPLKSPKKIQNKYKNQSTVIKPSSAIDDGLDDLLDDLLKKQQTKKQKQQSKDKNKSTDNFNSAAIKVSPPRNQQMPKIYLDKTDKFPPYGKFQSSKEIDFGMTNQFKPPQRHAKSIYQTNDNNYGQSFNDLGAFDKKSQTPVFSVAGSMRNMKPPLRKKGGDSRENSIRQRSVRQPSINDYQQFRDQQELPMANFQLHGRRTTNFDRRDSRKPSSQFDLHTSQIPQSNNQLFKKPYPQNNNNKNKHNVLPSTSPIKQKQIVYITQQNQQLKQKLKKQHQKQIQNLKEQNENKIKFVEEKLRSEIDDKRKVIKQFTQQRNKDRQQADKMLKRETQSLKQMHEWEIKRKSQIYEMEISEFKNINTMLKQQLQELTRASYQKNTSNSNEDLQYKLKQLDFQKNKLESNQRNLHQKQRALQSREFDFDNYRTKQTNKIQQQRKKLYQFEAELERRKLQFRKTMQEQRIMLSSDLAKQQMEYEQKRQKVKRQRQELTLENQLFEERKQQYQVFNNNILKEYKRKLKEVQLQKHNLQHLQIQTYQRLHTVQLMGTHRLSQNQQNHHHQQKQHLNITQPQSKTTRNKSKQFQQTQQRYRKVQQKLNKKSPSKYSPQPHLSTIHQSKGPISDSNLKNYLLRINRQNTRKRPLF